MELENRINEELLIKTDSLHLKAKPAIEIADQLATLMPSTQIVSQLQTVLREAEKQLLGLTDGFAYVFPSHQTTRLVPKDTAQLAGSTIEHLAHNPAFAESTHVAFVAEESPEHTKLLSYFSQYVTQRILHEGLRAQFSKWLVDFDTGDAQTTPFGPVGVVAQFGFPLTDYEQAFERVARSFIDHEGLKPQHLVLNRLSDSYSSGVVVTEEDVETQELATGSIGLIVQSAKNFKQLRSLGDVIIHETILSGKPLLHQDPFRFLKQRYLTEELDPNALNYLSHQTVRNGELATAQAFRAEELARQKDLNGYRSALTSMTTCLKLGLSYAIQRRRSQAGWEKKSFASIKANPQSDVEQLFVTAANHAEFPDQMTGTNASELYRQSREVFEEERELVTHE